ncbi:MAG: 2-amino-4-hydroxy-6-hydroxymethyldihydropteridine diphosphokinase [Candidatus Eremiobacteraeota bacterium]|nr:2-amino-4-hydroxy-6-hydroxymethyldihydropteridine diphosphokinase [Candidatus Eremiobacteraeota bacterium]
MPVAAIGIGANLDDARSNVKQALDLLSEMGTVLRRSRIYHTPPWGVRDQPQFVNAAALLETTLEPRALLRALQDLERRLGRVPNYRWGPRIIDLDLLTYDDREIFDDELWLPHPRMLERAFVLVPLAEIDEFYAPARDALPPEEVAAVHPIDERVFPV